MIELFDAERLLPRRDTSLPLAALALVLGAAGMGAYGWSLQQQLQAARSGQQALELQLKQAQGTPPPSATLVADLQRQAQQLEAALAVARQAAAGDGPGGSTSASGWLDRMGLLASPDISLSRIDIDRSGAVRVEGMAQSPQAVNGFVQAWSAQQRYAPMLARSIEVKQDKLAAPQLSFSMRATAPPLQTTKAAGP